MSDDDWNDEDVEDDKEMPQLETKDGKVDTKEIDPDTHNHSAIDDATGSLSGFSQLSAVIGGKKKGKSRAEAFAELNAEPVELLPGGELRLPSGKIIGHRDYKYIYR